jgi:formyl-CoA transferase
VSHPAGKPLSGVTVLDFTQVEFGPIATQTLGDFGADVIKIERPGHGDIIRHIDGFAEGIDDSAYYLSLNRNKQSVCIDLKHPEGVALVHRLLPHVDVIVENFRPGVMERFGLGYEQIHGEYPRVIYASGTGFGADGPLSRKGGQDMLAQALSGAAHHARDDEGRPRLHPVSFADFGAGMALVQGVLLAIIARMHTGQGQRVQVNLLDTMLFAQLQELCQWRLRGQETNFEKDNLAGIFPTEDGWLAVVGLFRPQPLKDICAALGIDDLTAAPEFADLPTQLANRDRLWPLLDEAFSRYTTADAAARLDARDILCAPVQDYAAVMRDAQVIRNASLIPVDHPTLGQICVVRAPVRLSEVDTARGVRPPPRLGQDTESVLVTRLGLTDADLDALRDQGVIA